MYKLIQAEDLLSGVRIINTVFSCITSCNDTTQ